MPISITQFSSGRVPCLDIEIEDEKFVVTLDLGFEGAVSIVSGVIQELTDKCFIKKTAVYGIRGNKHQRNVYQIPQLNIGHLVFSPIVLEEENELMKEESLIIKQENSPPVSPILGKLGWELFKSTVLFLDAGNS